MKYEPIASVLNQLIDGLDTFQLISKLKENPKLFRYLFCYTKTFAWSYNLLLEKLEVQWSDQGSNKKSKEVDIYKLLLDMLEHCYYSGEIILVFDCINNSNSLSDSMLRVKIENK